MGKCVDSVLVLRIGIRTLRYIGISREVSEDANGNFERTNAKSYKLSAKFTHNYSLASVFTSHFGFEFVMRLPIWGASRVNIVK